MITMKRNLTYSIISMLSMVFLLTSCNNYTFETPAYESISAKYIATSPYSDIKSLELSSSGNYIVIKNNGYYESYNIASRNAFVNNLVYSKTTKTRSAEYENIIYGKFTKIDENKYELEGYGTVIITKTDDENFDLEIALRDGRTLNVGARKDLKYTESVATNNLCRTWKITKVGLNVNMGIFKFKKMVDHAKIDNLLKDYLKEAIESEEDDLNEEELNEAIDEALAEYNEVKPISMIFTKSGSYMVEYQNGELGISTWKWENEDEGILRYSWNTDDINSVNLGGTCSVSYKKDMLMLTEILGAESEDDYDEGNENMPSISIIWGLEEVK